MEPGRTHLQQPSTSPENDLTAQIPGQNRVTISQRAPAVCCQYCGYLTAQIAFLINDRGESIDTTVLCTRCQGPGRHRA
jgi:hypothetical protein